VLFVLKKYDFTAKHVSTVGFDGQRGVRDANGTSYVCVLMSSSVSGGIFVCSSRLTRLTGIQISIDNKLIPELSDIAQRVPVYERVELPHAQKVIS
jgi:hypothetical protein